MSEKKSINKVISKTVKPINIRHISIQLIVFHNYNFLNLGEIEKQFYLFH